MGKRNREKDKQEAKNTLSKITVWQFAEQTPKDKRVITRVALAERQKMKKIEKISAATEIREAEMIVFSKEIKTMEENLDKHSEYLRKLETEKRELQKQLDELNRRIFVNKTNMNSAQEYHEYLETSIQKAKEHLKAEELKNAQLKRVYLVHPTANMKMLFENQLGEYVVTETDEKFSSGIMPDKVFKIFEHFLTEEKLPRDFFVRYQHEEERRSIIDYCEMVIYYTIMEEREIKLLYANEYIHKILVANGIIE